jgi:predicted unusual protein kinase regulating ubiquinone biosynthesis (AarF/ABC1/UbiB family)
LQARWVEIVVRLGLYFSGLAFDAATGTADTRDRVRFRAAQLRQTLTALGPSFIKAGQVCAAPPRRALQ